MFLKSICVPVLSQNITEFESITEIAEDLASDEMNSELVEIFIHQLNELLEDPVILNNADENEISRLFFLSEFQVKTLADHVQRSGNIVSVYEIASIPGFDRQTAEWMERFISLESGKSSMSKKPGLSNSLLTNIVPNPGERDSTCLGSPAKILMKYKFISGHLSGGLTAEKDQGEMLFSGSPPMPDYLSANMAYTGNGVIRKIILGDFGCRFGLGTNINTGIYMRPSLNSSGFMPVRNEINPWTSSDESRSLRGLAAYLSYKKLGLILFCSVKKMDASIEFSTDSSDIFVTNLLTSGIHDKPPSVEKKDVLSLTTCGLNITYNYKSLKTGLSWSYTGFSVPFSSASGNPEKLFTFSGSENNILSAHYNYLANKFLFFGEISLCSSEAISLVQGFTVRPSDRFQVNLLYRDFSPGFVSFHGSGPGITGSPSNEKGLWGNFSFEAAKHLFVSAGCDIATIPWLKFRTSFPSWSKRYLVRLMYIPNEKYSFDLSYNSRSSMYDLTREQGIALVSENTTKLFKGSCKMALSERLTAMLRADFILAGPSGSQGMLLLQDLNYRFRKIPVSIWTRYCIFRTDDWNSRLYAYENDLLYSFSIPALSGEGTRSYVMVKWDFKDFTELRIKYGFSEKQSGESATDPEHEIKFQLRLWF